MNLAARASNSHGLFTSFRNFFRMRFNERQGTARKMELDSALVAYKPSIKEVQYLRWKYEEAR